MTLKERNYRILLQGKYPRGAHIEPLVNKESGSEVRCFGTRLVVMFKMTSIEI